VVPYSCMWILANMAYRPGKVIPWNPYHS
jgi:hypothetical protein